MTGPRWDAGAVVKGLTRSQNPDFEAHTSQYFSERRSLQTAKARIPFEIGTGSSRAAAAVVADPRGHLSAEHARPTRRRGPERHRPVKVPLELRAGQSVQGRAVRDEYWGGQVGDRVGTYLIRDSSDRAGLDSEDGEADIAL